MKILLDTHTWIWAEECPENLGRKSKESLLSPKTELFISPISSLEIAQLIFKKRIYLSCELQEWINRSIENLKIKTAELNHTLAISAFVLPEPLHNDPADRILIATARHLRAHLMTVDSKILGYSHLNTLDARV